MVKKKALILLSGGIDSVTSLMMTKEEGYQCDCISFDYGQRNQIELTIAEEFAISEGCSFERVLLKLPYLEQSESVLTNLKLDLPKGEINERPSSEIGSYYVPARNTIFISNATLYALNKGGTKIVLGIIKSDSHPDRRPEYIKAFQNLLDVANIPIQLMTPLKDYAKDEVIKKGLELGIDYTKTLSCYNPTGRLSCGDCRACRGRKKGFEKAGLEDPTYYLNER